MNRREFFARTIGAIVVAAVLKPKPIVIPMRKMMARIRITQEALDDFKRGTPWLYYDTEHDEWYR